MTTVASERVQEALRYAKGEMPDSAIREVRIDLDRDGDFIVLFENGDDDNYGMYIVLQDVTNLGWKECQALADVMRVSSRGKKMDNDAFRKVLEQLERKYGKTEGPAERSNRLCGGVFPGPGDVRAEEDDTIVRTAMGFDRDTDLLFQAETKGGNTYKIFLELTGTDKSLYEKDCEALIDILGMLETGDCVSETKFWAYGYILRKKYNIVRAMTTPEGAFVLSVLASSVESTDPIDPILEEAFQEEAAKQLVQVAGAMAELNDSSPYPGISFTRPISEGGQGKVFAGIRQGKEVAVKIFCAEEGEEDDALDAFKTELRLLLKMSKHNHVVSVLDFFETPQPALVMSLVDGEDLMDYLEDHGPMSSEEGRKMAIGIADGLCHLHRHGIIHRDLKSSNILRKRDGTPIIIDLGLGAVLERSSKRSASFGIHQLTSQVTVTHVSAQTGAMKGTIMWMAPEMITENSWSDKTDVYGFGVMMWEIFSGKKPFEPEDGKRKTSLQILLEIAQGGRPDMRAVRHVDKDLLNIMQMCWDTDPKKRPSMRRVLDMLNGNDPEGIFNAIDTDKSGSLDFGEFVNFLQRYAPGKVKVSEMHVLFTAIDDDNSGKIELDEFLAFWRQVEIHGLTTAVNLAARKDLDVSKF